MDKIEIAAELKDFELAIPNCVKFRSPWGQEVDLRTATVSEVEKLIAEYEKKKRQCPIVKKSAASKINSVEPTKK